MTTSKQIARLRLRYAIQLAQDIHAYRTSDPSRFDRMVNGQGKGIVTEALLIKNIRVIAEETRLYYPRVTARLLNWL